MRASPEFTLAAACAIWPRSPRKTRVVVEAAAAPVDWGRFLRLVERHRIIGLAHDALTAPALDVPDEARSALSTAQRASSQRSLVLAAESVRLQRLLDAAGIPAAFLKGTSLAALAFGDVGLGPGGDIDVLVAPQDVPRGLECLRSAGYTLHETERLQTLMASSKDVHLFRHGLVVELHWRLLANADAMARAPIASRLRKVRVGHGAEIATLGEDDLFVYLCIHGAGHGWERLQWLADVAALLERTSPEHIEKLLHAARLMRGARAVAQAILLCRAVFGTPIPNDVAARLSAGMRMRTLCKLGLATLTADPATSRQRRLSTLRVLLTRFLLAEGWRSLVGELRYQWVLPADMQAVPLPRPLWFLYPVLRLPLWVWRRLAP